VRYKIDLSYDGTEFHGWQIQPNAVTVQQLINDKLKLVLQEKINTMGSGRTDTGVHARKQVLHVDIQKEIPKNLIFRLNKLLPDSIAIINIKPVKDDFHARYHAQSRAYEYLIHQNKNPFLEKYSYNFNKVLEIDLMNSACQILIQHTNFESFSKVHTEVNNFNCVVTQAFWRKEKNHYKFYIKANRFLRNMVRAIVGTLLEVGEGKIDLDQFQQIIISKNRNNAGRSVPAQGLYLTEVNYDKV
jgi:tRNA pseudouridine38-40 synthase